MNRELKKYANRFNSLSLRERVLLVGSFLVTLLFIWWNYYAAPLMQTLDKQKQQYTRVVQQVDLSRMTITAIRQRMKSGVHGEKLKQLAKLKLDLKELEAQLHIKTIELIDPEKMFQLMSRLVYSDSGLSLLSLKRREVKPAMPVGDDKKQDVGIYRHVLEIELSGNYLDILAYTQALEALDWKLLWDEIEITNQKFPLTRVKVVISTLSTRKEWVGV